MEYSVQCKHVSCEVSDKIPDTEEEEEVEVVATVQQAVSYFTSNNNKVMTISALMIIHSLLSV